MYILDVHVHVHARYMCMHVVLHAHLKLWPKDNIPI